MMTDGTVTTGPLAIPQNLADILKPHAQAVLHDFQFTAKAIEQSGGVFTSSETFDWMIEGLFATAALRGYYQALLDNVGKLRLSAEAVAEKQQFKNNVQPKGAKATKRKAEPRHKAIRHRYRELRKQGYAKGEARQEIVDEYTRRKDGISFKTVERVTKHLR